jgi:hypothetical protein
MDHHHVDAPHCQTSIVVAGIGENETSTFPSASDATDKRYGSNGVFDPDPQVRG